MTTVGNNKFYGIPRNLLTMAINDIKSITPYLGSVKLTQSDILSKYPTVCSFRSGGRSIFLWVKGDDAVWVDKQEQYKYYRCTSRLGE